MNINGTYNIPIKRFLSSEVTIKYTVNGGTQQTLTTTAQNTCYEPSISSWYDSSYDDWVTYYTVTVSDLGVVDDVIIFTIIDNDSGESVDLDSLKITGSMAGSLFITSLVLSSNSIKRSSLIK